MVSPRGEYFALLEPFWKILLVPCRLFGDQDESSTGSQGSAGGEHQFLGNLEITEVGWIGKRHIKGTRLAIIAVGIEFGGYVLELVQLGPLFDAPYGS